MGLSVRAGCSDADTKLPLIRQKRQHSQHNLELNYVSITGSNIILPSNSLLSDKENTTQVVLQYMEDKSAKKSPWSKQMSKVEYNNICLQWYCI